MNKLSIGVSLRTGKVDVNDSARNFNYRGKHTPSERAANKGYPGIRTTKNGGPDFEGTPYLYPAKEGQKNIVKIKLTGSRGEDFKEANRLAGFKPIKKSPVNGYTWHHLDDFDPITGESTLQLIQSKAHRSTFTHKGSAGQYQDFYGIKYKP